MTVKTVPDSKGVNQFIYIRGKLVMKRWLDKQGRKRQPSRIFNEQWPDVIVSTKENI